MILVAGIPSEPPVKLVTEAAEQAGIQYVLFNQRKAHFYQLSMKFADNRFQGLLNIDGQDYALEELSGTYIRFMDSNSLPEISDKVFNYIGEAQANKSGLIHKQLLQWMEVTTGRILNRPSDMLSNLSKPYQAQLIAKNGFKVPPTCITSCPGIVQQFKSKYPHLIFKSVSSARSIVKELDLIREKDLYRIKYLPTQFQEKLEGVNIRVHVAGDALFATMAASPVVDYRYAAREGQEALLTPWQLPRQIEKRCFSLAKSLNLNLCGIDLFLTDSGEYYCFEVNPSPGYSYYQQNTGQDIATAIVKWLEYGTAK